VQKRNYPLLVGSFIVQGIVLYDFLGNLSNPYWYAQQGWSCFVLSSTTVLLIFTELSGMLRERPMETVAVCILYVLALLAIDLMLTYGSGRQFPFPFLVAGLIALTYTLATTMIFEGRPHPLIGVIVGLGLVYAYEVLQWRDQPVAVASLFASWLIWLISGFSAFRKREEKGTLYAVGCLASSIVLIGLSLWITVMSMGFSSSY
jgi:hypothetical protein